MSKIKKGDIVGRISYGSDILFEVQKIIKLKNGKNIAILKGIATRIVADAPISDLELSDKVHVENRLRSLDSKLEERIKKYAKIPKSSLGIFKRGIYGNSKEVIRNGTILHLDGDKKYSEKSARYYKSIGVNAIVKNIPENKQPQMVVPLLNRYNPDILVITGHDRDDKKWNWLL